MNCERFNFEKVYSFVEIDKLIKQYVCLMNSHRCKSKLVIYRRNEKDSLNTSFAYIIIRVNSLNFISYFYILL